MISNYSIWYDCSPIYNPEEWSPSGDVYVGGKYHQPYNKLLQVISFIRRAELYFLPAPLPAM